MAVCNAALALSHFSISVISYTNLENAFCVSAASGFRGRVIVGRGRIVMVVVGGAPVVAPGVIVVMILPGCSSQSLLSATR